MATWRPFNLGALGAASVGLALSSASPVAFAVDYMTPQQAQQAQFPHADRFVPRVVKLDAAQLQAIGTQIGAAARTAQWTVAEAWQGQQLLGWVVIDNVVGKFELITYAVGLDAQGKVLGVDILSYRESHGAEIRLPAWRAQFVGKGPASPLRVGQDVQNLSGATLSCGHVTEGVRRIVAVVAQARQARQL
jgi:Na+-translocating ferredoxin:NAD+ oxidoreductase RnfG subunit